MLWVVELVAFKWTSILQLGGAVGGKSAKESVDLILILRMCCNELPHSWCCRFYTGNPLWMTTCVWRQTKNI